MISFTWLSKTLQSREVTISTDSLFGRIYDEQVKSREQVLHIINFNTILNEKDKTIKELKVQIAELKKEYTGSPNTLRPNCIKGEYRGS